MTAVFNKICLSLMFLIVHAGLGQAGLDATLRKLTKDAGQSALVAKDIGVILSQYSNSDAARETIRDSFCRALSGRNCSPGENVEAPVHYYSSQDQTLVCVVAEVVAGGEMNAILYSTRKEGEKYVATSASKLYGNAAAYSELLPSQHPDALRLLVYGPEINANRSPLTVVIVDSSATGGTNVIYERHHLWGGQITHTDNTVTIESRSLEPILDRSGKWVDTMSVRSVYLGQSQVKETERKIPVQDVKP